MLRALSIAALTFAPAGYASEDIADQYPGSALYSKPVEVIPGVWSAIGATAPPTYENTGHNTDQSVKLVINENGQGHAMLGNSYWFEQQVPILAHIDAVHEFEQRGSDSLEAMKRYNRGKADGTVLVKPTKTFEHDYIVEMGQFRLEVLYLGPAHSPGDVLVWLPKQSLVIAGDMAFHERLLPIFAHTMTAEWIETWDSAFENLQATYVIPGHGHPTNMAQVRRYTRDYLVYLRNKIADHLDAGGDLAEAYYVDQTPYAHLDTFEELATRNAGRVYEQMEFE